jgi:hypothetical protein
VDPASCKPRFDVFHVVGGSPLQDPAEQPTKLILGRDVFITGGDGGDKSTVPYRNGAFSSQNTG